MNFAFGIPYQCYSCDPVKKNGGRKTRGTHLKEKKYEEDSGGESKRKRLAVRPTRT